MLFGFEDAPVQLNEPVDLGQNDFLALSKNNISHKQKYMNPKGEIFTTQISKNKRFIITGGTKCQLDIWFSKRSKMIKTIKFQCYRVMESIFSFNDEYIYVALPNKLIIISIVRGLKKVQQRSLGRWWARDDTNDIQNIIELKQNIIGFCYDNIIYEYDFVNNQLRTLLQLDDKIHFLDYKPEQNTFVCGSNSQLSLFINNNLFIKQEMIDQAIIKQQMDEQEIDINIFQEGPIIINQLKFFNNSYIVGIIGWDFIIGGDLIMWYIDHSKKELIKKIIIQVGNVRFQFNLHISLNFIILFCKNSRQIYQLQKQNKNQFIDQKGNNLY